MTPANALSIDVYRSADGRDCTNDGISTRYDELLVLCDDGPHEIDLDDPPENLVRLVKRHLFGSDIYHVEPFARPTGAGWMFGGNYAASSDSRYHRLTFGMYGAVPVHDRQESWPQYEMLSH